MRRSPALLAGFSPDDRIACSRSPELNCRTHIELDRTGVMFGGRQLTYGEIFADQIERGEINADADRGLACLHVHEGRYSDPHALGPGGE
jgi:hypothetical protein